MGFNGATWDRIASGVTSINTTFTGMLNTIPQAIYNATPTSRTEGQRGWLQATALGHLIVSLGTDIRGENATTKRLDVSTPHSTAIMTTATTTTHLTGAGRFRGLRIGKDVGTAIITVHDNTAGSGPILYRHTSAATAGTHIPPIPCDVPVTTGITVVTSQAGDVNIDWSANP